MNAVKIELDSFSIASVFKFPDVIDKADLLEQLDNKNFDVVEEVEEKRIPVEEAGVRGEVRIGKNRIATKGNVDILYNPHVSLAGFPKSSFLTAKGSNPRETKINFTNIYKIAKNMDENIDSKIALYESVSEGRIRSGKESFKQIARIWDENKKKKIAGILDADPDSMGGGVRLLRESWENSSNPGWFDLILDSSAENPYVYIFRFVKRVEDFKEIKFNNIENYLRELVQVLGR